MTATERTSDVEEEHARQSGPGFVDVAACVKALSLNWSE